MSGRKKKFFITLFLVIFLNLFLIAVCYFLFVFTNSKKTALSRTKNEILEYEERIKNIKDLEKGLGQFERERTDIGSLFLNKVSIVNFIEELEYLARKTGVNLEKKDVSAAETQVKPIFRFSVSGEFEEIYHFIYLLENDIYYVGFELVGISKDEETGFWDGDLVLKLLSFKE